MTSLKTSTKLFYFLYLVNLYALEMSWHAVGNNDVIMPFLGTVMEEMLIAAWIYHHVEYKGFLRSDVMDYIYYKCISTQVL